MIDNNELPIGFAMELARHSDILNQFAGLSKEEQESMIQGAKQTKSRNEMRKYVENMFHYGTVTPDSSLHGSRSHCFCVLNFVYFAQTSPQRYPVRSFHPWSDHDPPDMP